MKTIKVECSLSIGYANAHRKDEIEIEVEDDATEKQIEQQIDSAVTEWANNFIDVGWGIIKTT